MVNSFPTDAVCYRAASNWKRFGFALSSPRPLFKLHPRKMRGPIRFEIGSFANSTLPTHKAALDVEGASGNLVFAAE
jgi:hypothetical protein